LSEGQSSVFYISFSAPGVHWQHLCGHDHCCEMEDGSVGGPEERYIVDPHLLGTAGTNVFRKDDIGEKTAVSGRPKTACSKADHALWGQPQHWPQQLAGS